MSSFFDTPKLDPLASMATAHAQTAIGPEIERLLQEALAPIVRQAAKNVAEKLRVRVAVFQDVTSDQLQLNVAFNGERI